LRPIWSWNLRLANIKTIVRSTVLASRAPDISIIVGGAADLVQICHAVMLHMVVREWEWNSCACVHRELRHILLAWVFDSSSLSLAFSRLAGCGAEGRALLEAQFEAQEEEHDRGLEEQPLHAHREPPSEHDVLAHDARVHGG